jgi:hypothetical protein
LYAFLELFLTIRSGILLFCATLCAVEPKIVVAKSFFSFAPITIRLASISFAISIIKSNGVMDMNSFNSIVVGLDISNNAQEVLNRTFLVAKRNSSEVVIVHAVDIGLFGNLISDSKIEKLKIAAVKSIEKELETVNTQDIKYSISVEKASPSDFIINCITYKN